MLQATVNEIVLQGGAKTVRYLAAFASCTKSSTPSCSGRESSRPVDSSRWIKAESADFSSGFIELRLVFLRWLKQVFLMALKSSSSQPNDSLSFLIKRITAD